MVARYVLHSCSSTYTHTYLNTHYSPPGDETTSPGWEFAVIVDIKEEAEVSFSVVYDFNGEQVRLVLGGEDDINSPTHTYTQTHTLPFIHRPGFRKRKSVYVGLATLRGVN